MSDLDMKALIAGLMALGNAGQKATEKAVGTSTFTWGHGPGGLFSQAGLSPDVANAMVMPELGLQAILPVRSSRETNPLHAVMTGVTNLTNGTNADGPCSDCPTAGLMKLCTQTYVFGRFCLSTQVLDITRAGQIVNRGEFTDLRLIGGPQNATGTDTGPSMPFDINAAMTTELNKNNFEFKVSWARLFAKKLFDGNPFNNTGNGGYKEFRGLDLLINTGYRDAETGAACPAADSQIINFGSANIGTAAPALALVNDVQGMYHYLKNTAEMSGLAPVRFALAMPRMLFWELSKVWPIAYNTIGATVIAASETNTQLMVDARSNTNDRDAMRNGRYLMIDGEQVPVVFDSGIATANSGGTYTSPIYFVPLTVLGGTPATYIEYFDFAGPGAAMDVAGALGVAGAFSVTDGGRYLWVKKPSNNYCVQAQATSSDRVRLDFPQLAGRITNVSYTPLISDRSPFPSDSTFYDGGKTNRTDYAPSFWSPNTAG